MATAADPDQPHLSQAWVAQSTGDGLQGEIGEESYLIIHGGKGHEEGHHLWDYGAECRKLVTCPLGTLNFGCTAYYQKCYATNCCKCEGVESPKEWDIPKQTMFVKNHFVGYEDTTELNENPVAGAEHWNSKQMLAVEYDYYLHRNDANDVISHRIDYGVNTGNESSNLQGSILYGDFEPQHDIDAHRQRFAVPEVCQGNIVSCGGCDDDGSAEIDEKWFKHAHFLRQMKQNAIQV